MTTTLSTMQVASTLCISFAAVRYLARAKLLRTVERDRFEIETVRAFVASGSFEALRVAGEI